MPVLLWIHPHLHLHVQFVQSRESKKKIIITKLLRLQFIQKKQKYNFIFHQIEINIYLSLHTICVNV